MPDQSTAVPRARVSSDPRVVVIDSYAFSLSVRRGHVVVKSGGEERSISRVDAAKTRDGVARIVILSRVGTISVEVMRWAAALDVAIFQLGKDGTMALCSPGLVTTDARMYKQQVMAQPEMPSAKTGLEIVRELLTAKIAGQLEVLKLTGQDSPRMAECITMMAVSRDIRSMLSIEGNAAIAYWKHWEQRVFVPWDLDALRYVPAHWSSFGGRAGISTMANGRTTSNRNATDFVNACLNYAYKICETEAMYACHATGLHPGLGLSHGEIHDNKPGMALDIIEPLRPIADRVVLSYLDSGHGIPFDDTGRPAYISRDSAYELENGTCRLFPPMTTRLASAVSMAVAGPAMRWAEKIARSLAATTHISVIAPFDPRIRERKEMAELAPDTTTEDLVPGALWSRVEPLIPLRPSGHGPPLANPRGVLASVVAHELYGVAWPKAARVSGITWQKCKKRFLQWQESGTWDAVKAEITKTESTRQQRPG
jgi:CRISP-associated protein Cas1